MSRLLGKTVVVGGVMYPAGTAVPDDVAKGITAKGVWAGPAETDPEPDGEPQGYDKLKVAELKAQIARRNEGRDDADLLSAEGKKADLIAVLEADDAEADAADAEADAADSGED